MMKKLFNDHNVYLLGAGFSVPGRMPLINNFLNHMRDAQSWYIKNDRMREVQYIDQVFDFRLSASSAAYRINIDLENIEQLFSLASASDAESTISIKHAICSTIKYCQNKPKPYLIIEIQEKNFDLPFFKSFEIDSNPAGTQLYLKIPFYDYLAGVLSGLFVFGSRNSIITFNYDTLVEESLERIGENYSYIFNETNEEQEGKTTPLLKLHGSTNWGYYDKKIKILNDYDEILESKYEPVIVPPTWNKTFNGELRTIWNAAINHIAQATRIIFVGFSMPETDLHFKYLLAAGLKNNISLREIVVIDKNINDLESKIDKLFNNDKLDRVKIKPIQSKTESFFSNANFSSINRRLAPEILNVNYFMNL